MQDKLALLLRHPLVTYGMTLVMVLASAVAVISDGSEGSETAEALDAARTFYEQNAEVTVSERNRQLLGPAFVDIVAVAYEKEKDRGAGPVFSARMQDRTQRRFEALADAAFDARMREFAAWRFGVASAGTPPPNHLIHVFVHASWLALFVTLAFFVVTSIGLEMAWGSAVFAGFCLLGTVLPSLAFRFVDAGGGIPLAGATGLVGAVLGAYFVRGLGGGLPLPGWALLPVWAFIELFFVRRIWIENLETAPWATLGAGVGFGIVAASAVRMLGIEKKLVERDTASEAELAHPALGVAERAIAMGNPSHAWQALTEAQAETPGDERLTLALWELACEQGRVEEVAHVIAPVLNDRLRRGETAEAVGYWRVVCDAGCSLPLQPAALVKLGEGLLDEGHPEIALETLTRAADHERGLSTALAQRVVRIARDLDPALTHRAAAIALADPALDPASRESLEVLADEVRAAIPPEPAPEPAPVAAEAPPAEPAPSVSETTRYPIDSDIDLNNAGELTDPDEFNAMEAARVSPAAAAEDEVDPNALSIASLEKELAGDLGLDEGEELTDPEAWNDPSLRAGLGDDPVDAALEADVAAAADTDGFQENAHIDAGALDPGALSGEAPTAPPDGGIGSPSDTAPLAPLGSDPGRLGAAAPAHTKLGQATPPPEPESPPERTPLAPLGTTPLVALDDEMLGDPDAATDPLGAPSPEISGAPPEPMPPSAAAPAPAPTPAAEPSTASPFGDDDLETDFDIGPPTTLRPLKLVVGVPIGAKPQALEVEVEGRGVSRVPFERIEAVAVAAVAGLSEKPVLIIDLVLNWLADPEQPLKVVRFHSNRFNPTTVVPSATSSVDALKRLVGGIVKRSGATPLPSPDALSGSPFARYPDSATYEREVLGAES